MSLLRTAGRAAVASSVHGRVQRRQQQRWSRQAAAPEPTPGPAAGPPPAAPSTDLVIEQLTRLKELRDAGVLSDAELEAQKAIVLRG